LIAWDSVLRTLFRLRPILAPFTKSYLPTNMLTGEGYHCPEHNLLNL
jgi:hypothetical protein